MSHALLNDLLQYRLDAVVFTALAVAACGYCGMIVHRRKAQRDFWRLTWPIAALLLAAGLFVSEWAASEITFPAVDRSASLLIARSVILAGMAFLIAVHLASATLVALMRAEIREHAETERQLERAKTAADEANRAKSDFLAVMSHEIRTPLNAVMGFANLLAETRLDDAQRGYLATINSEGRRLTSLISDILDLTKIEQGRLILERLPFAPVEIAQEVLRLLSPRAQEKKIDLRFEAHLAGPLLVSGDPLRFRQVLLNLMDNATKFTAEGSVTLFLSWTPPEAGAPHGQLGVAVRDTGVGIPPDKLRHLFQMFMQVDTSTTRRYGGTGLGLAICHRLVTLMGGVIAAQSTPGAGTEFSVVLPIHAVSTADEAATPEPDALPLPTQRPVILVVDDMDTNRFLLEVFLTRHGFQPELAANGEEAVRLATERRYDAILMDLQMPDIDGYTATQRIRATETGGRRTPIIALTASIAQGTREKCLAMGMDEYLTKPLDLRRFKRLLTQLIAPADAPPAQLQRSET